MRGVSQSAGLTGGSGSPGRGDSHRSNKFQKNQKQRAGENSDLSTSSPTQQTSQKAQESTPDQKSASSGGKTAGTADSRDDSSQKAKTQQPTTAQEKTEQAIDKKRQDITKTKQDLSDIRKKTLDQKGQDRSLKRVMNHARYSAKKRELKKSKQQLKKLEKTNELQKITSGLLRNSWIHIISSWGFTIFYICFHFGMAYFTPFSTFFCKLGEEWRFVQVIKKKSRATGERIAKPLEMAEGFGCCIIIGILGFISFVIIILFVTIAYIYIQPLSAIKLFITEVLARTIRSAMGIFDPGAGGN